MRQVTLTLNYILLACIGLIYFGNNPAFAEHKNNHDGLSVDFRYMPPEWQTSICLPDDPFKSIVDKSGDLLYHYLRIKKVTEGFRTQVRIQIADDLVWEKQELHSPRVPIVRTYLAAKGLEVVRPATMWFSLRSKIPVLRHGSSNLSWRCIRNLISISGLTLGRSWSTITKQLRRH
jgi:hypothetical protein